MAKREDENWQRALDFFYVGKIVHGEVYERAHYGFFIQLKHPEIEDSFVGLISITEYKDFVSVNLSDFPEIGSEVRAVVLGHRTHNQQVWLGMKSSHFDD